MIYMEDICLPVLLAQFHTHSILPMNTQAFGESRVGHIYVSKFLKSTFLVVSLMVLSLFLGSLRAQLGARVEPVLLPEKPAPVSVVTLLSHDSGDWYDRKYVATAAKMWGFVGDDPRLTSAFTEAAYRKIHQDFPCDDPEMETRKAAVNSLGHIQA